MHELIEYACSQLEEIEKKAKKGNVSMSELEYANKLAELKKNLLKGNMLYEEEMGGEYSGNMMGGGYGSYARGSYARGRRGNVRRDAMGRYSRDAEDMVDQLRDLMEDAPDEQTRREIEKLVRKMESM